MIRSNKFFIIAIILGVLVIAVVGIAVLTQNEETAPVSLNAGNEEANQDTSAPVPEATGNIDDMVDSLERGLYEEASVIYEEDQDAGLIDGDMEAAGEAAESIDIELE
ncbi:MAG: hypothetical protein Q8N69_01490 [bacterium]|nr:hypothetical protein [bacterium]